MRNFTDAEILARIAKLPSFTHYPDLLLVGIRNKTDQFNKFDDKFFFYKNDSFITRVMGTTNPGAKSLLGGWVKTGKPGSAILKADEIYYDAYEFGLHRGKMRALRQVRPMLYYRDGNNDRKVDEVGKVYKENAFTNFHFSDYDLYTRVIKTLIGGWSEGCQVAVESSGYNAIIDLVELESKPVTYALLKEF